jgi:hypothetical protein
MPGLESTDYLPTQVVAEYLAAHPDMQLDGVMFTSSQIAVKEGKETDSQEQQGKNVVLFSHASRLERHDVPGGAEIEVYRYHGDPDDPEHSIWIRETVPDAPETEDSALSPDLFDLRNPVHSSDLPDDLADPSMRLDMESIEVRRIEGVSYQTFSIDVSRHRIAARDSDF